VEKFFNAGSGLCFVLKRVGTTALILRTDCTCEPYVVPMEHVRGSSDWWQGRYFNDLDRALEYFEKEVSKQC